MSGGTSPLGVLFEMIKRMRKDIDLPGSQGWQHYYNLARYNRYFLSCLLCAHPLRISMLMDLKIGENLYKDESGEWRIRFINHRFKNRRYLSAKSKYDVKSPVWFQTILDEYIGSFRPLMPGGSNDENGKPLCEYLIRPAIMHGNFGHCKRVSTITSAKWVYEATKIYLPETGGFNPHAFRHIVGTHLLKLDPNNVMFVAKALHISRDTVERVYAHLLMGDWEIEYTYIQDKLWNK